jgi:putative flippase GtrA
MKQFASKIKHNGLSQFLSYVFVGGTAALVEWGVYWLCDHFEMQYLLATTVAFIFSTFVNWLMGHFFAFKCKLKNVSKKRVFSEISAVYTASFVGLLINLGLMLILVPLFLGNKMFSKVLSTAFVFIWNFLIRKLLIYRQPKCNM